MESSDPERLYRLFHPFAVERTEGVRQNGTRFVHYTNATAAESILRNREVWMRRVDCMNDYMEVLHGVDCLSNAFNNSIGKDFWNFFDAISTELRKKFQIYLKDGYLFSKPKRILLAFLNTLIPKTRWDGSRCGESIAVGKVLPWS